MYAHQYVSWPDGWNSGDTIHQGAYAVPEKYPYLTLKKKKLGGEEGSQKLKILKESVMLSHQLSKEVGVGDS